MDYGNTLQQILGLGILWAVKSSPAALAFPFFVIAMVPYRMSLKFLFSPMELEAVSSTSGNLGLFCRVACSRNLAPTHLLLTITIV